MRKLKLMNIRTGEVRELDVANTQCIDDIVKILLDSKLRIREQLTDEQFIELSKGRVEKYKLQSNNTFTMEELVEIDKEKMEAEKVDLDF